MTLIVGILCSDGVVIGSDGLAVYGQEENRTIVQEYPEKIEIIDNQIITAWTGEIGLQQRFNDTTESLWRRSGKDGIKKKTSLDIGRMVSKDAIGDFRQTHLATISFGALVAIQCTENNKNSVLLNLTQEIFDQR